MHKAETIKRQETARSVVYRRLADAFRLPSADQSEGWKELAAALAQLDSDARQKALDLAETEAAEPDRCQRKVDYAGLFAGPFTALAPPYGSVYLEDKRQLMGTSTIDVQEHYRHLGLDLSPDFKDAPDHICAELEFMHVLVHQAIAAVDAGDGELLTASIGQQRTFLERHLGAWVPAFADKVAEHARTDFYRLLASVVRVFVAEDMAALPDLPVDHTSPTLAGA